MSLRQRTFVRLTTILIANVDALQRIRIRI